MSLARKTYVKNWDHMKPEERHKIVVTKDGKPTKINPERVSYIEEEVARWRKANAIHKWFVKNAQDGEDDCKTYYVSSEQLEELVSTCELVIKASKMVKGKIENGYTYEGTTKVPIMADGKYIKDSSVAQKLLPTESGFFFGGTNYDEYYLDDLVYTRNTLKAVLAEGAGGEYYYHSSW